MHRVPVEAIMAAVRDMFNEHEIEYTDGQVLDLASDIKNNIGGVRLREVPWISNYAADMLPDEDDITYEIFRSWMMEHDRIFCGHPAGEIRDQMLEYLRHHGSLPAIGTKGMLGGYGDWLRHVGIEDPEKIKVDLEIKT